MDPFSEYKLLKSKVAEVAAKYIVAIEDGIGGHDHVIPSEKLDAYQKEVMGIMRAFVIGLCVSSTPERMLEELKKVVGDLTIDFDKKNVSGDKRWRDSLFKVLEDRTKALARRGTTITKLDEKTKQLDVEDTTQKVVFKNKIFVFTGTLRHARHRAEGFVEKRGGRTSPNVTYQTSYLVVGSNGDLNDKYTTAKNKGVKIIGEKQFYQAVDGIAEDYY